MKRIALATALTAGVLTLSACNQSQADESEVVVETKNGNVTKEEFYQELKDRHGEELLHEMVVKEVLNDKYEVTEEEVKKEVQKYKDQYGDKFGQALQQMGIENEEQFINTVEYSLLQQKAATANIEVTDEEIQQHYDRMKNTIEASHILVKDQQKAQEILKELDNGANFGDLAKEYSQDPSGKNGGQLGTFGPGQMVQPFEDAAYSLEVGEVSKPVSSQFGIHIIKVTDKIENEDVEPLEEIKGDITRQLKTKKIDQNSASAGIDQLIEDANVDVKDEEFKDLFKSPDKEASAN